MVRDINGLPCFDYFDGHSTRSLFLLKNRFPRAQLIKIVMGAGSKMRAMDRGRADPMISKSVQSLISCRQTKNVRRQRHIVFPAFRDSARYPITNRAASRLAAT